MADVVLRGMAWAHARGYDPMVATAEAYMRAHPGVTIRWERRSLQAFADRPVAEMAGAYDLIVVDHPHMGEAAREGTLLPLDGLRDDEMAALASGSVGASHASYQWEGRQWALAIDAATPVAAVRPDRLDRAPSLWSEVLDLAHEGQVAFSLYPINTLMTFFGMARNLGHPVAEDPDRLVAREHGVEMLGILREALALMDPRVLTLEPIGIYEWMSREADAPACSPFGYGYSNYARAGFRPFRLSFHDAPGLRGPDPSGTVLGGTGIAVSAFTRFPDVATDYAFKIAGAEWQRGVYAASGGQPAHAAAWDDDACNALTGDFFRDTRRTIETAWMRPRYDGYMRLQDGGGAILHEALRAAIRENAALDALDDLYRRTRRRDEVLKGSR